MRILLLAGGGGTRLWPLSTRARPKQFLPLVGSRSLLADTYERVSPLSSEIFVATFRSLRLARPRGAPRVPRRGFCSSPFRRNSAPPSFAPALDFEAEGDPSRLRCVGPRGRGSGSVSGGPLRRARARRLELDVVVLAVTPSRPDTEFGYLEVSSTEIPNGYDVARFARSGPSPGPDLFESGRQLLERRDLRFPSLRCSPGPAGGGQPRERRSRVPESGSATTRRAPAPSGRRFRTSRSTTR